MRLVVITLGLLLIASVAFGRPPDGGDSDGPMADWYRNLERPDLGGSCCSASDCRPVDSRMVGDHYEAFVDRKSFGVDAPDDWLAIPNGKVLRNRENPTGRAVLCWLKSTGPMCFVKYWES